MRENPERVAWTILLISFFVFCLLIVSIPLGIRQFIFTATQNYPALVTAYGGTVLMYRTNDEAPTGITEKEKDQEIQEGTMLETDPSSQAVVRLFDDSNLLVRNKSRVTILQAHIPRFSSSPEPVKITVETHSGKVIIGVAPAPEERLRRFEVRTPHGVILLEEGSYSIGVTETETEVRVRTVKAVGNATLQAAGESIVLGLGERGRIEAGQLLEGPLPGEGALLVNGDFQQPLSVGWISWEDRQKADEAPGSGAIDQADGTQVIHFVRQGDNKQHAKNGIRQELDLDVRDASSLEVRLNVRLIFQGLSGGGEVSSEFPLMVRLIYRDVNGRQHDWVRGFYYANWDNLGVRDDEAYRGILIERNAWYPFESENLMLTLGDQKPAHLITLEVYASGHDYESMASDVGLFVKE